MKNMERFLTCKTGSMQSYLDFYALRIPSSGWRRTCPHHSASGYSGIPSAPYKLQDYSSAPAKSTGYYEIEII